MDKKFPGNSGCDQPVRLARSLQRFGKSPERRGETRRRHGRPVQHAAQGFSPTPDEALAGFPAAVMVNGGARPARATTRRSGRVARRCRSGWALSRLSEEAARVPAQPANSRCPKEPCHHSAARQVGGTEPGRDHLPISTGEPALKPDIQNRRGHRRCSQRCLDQPHRPTRNHNLNPNEGPGRCRSVTYGVGINLQSHPHDHSRCRQGKAIACLAENGGVHQSGASRRPLPAD